MLNHSPRSLRRACTLAALCAILAACGRAEEPARTAPDGSPEPRAEQTPAEARSAGEPAPLPDVEPRPGWLAEIRPAAGGLVTTISPTASFTLEPGQSIHPAVAPDGLRVDYTALLDVPEPGRYRLVAEAEGGTAEMRVFDAGGRELSEPAPARTRGRAQTQWMDLADEPHTISLAFERRAGEPARFRPMWERQGAGAAGFVAEAIPTSLLSVPAHATDEAARATLATEGRVLLGELGCVACHETDASAAHALIERQAPLLGEIGRSASPDWLRRWIADPHEVKPRTGMPDVFPENDEAEIEAIVHYLASLAGPVAAEPVATEPAVLDRGRSLYHGAGCVACHGALESPRAAHADPAMPDEIPAYDPPHPFGDLAGKWNPSALASFLADPLRTHPGGRMPAMDLAGEEADLIATYLADRWGPADPAGFRIDPDLVETGRAAFASRGCANCHQIGANQAPVAPGVEGPALLGMLAGAGPMDPLDEVHVRYDLTDRQRAAMRVALEQVQLGAAHPAPLDEAYLRIGALGCTTCHTKDARGGLADGVRPYFTTDGEAELGDEGRLPPHLSGVGFKLTTPWLRDVLTDAGRARPYMSARMPQFGQAHAGPLAELLAAIDGVEPDTDETEPEATDDLVLAGRTLSGESGLNCISCHVFDDLPPAGTPGPDMTRFAERLRYAWWRDYLLDPPRFKPGTRMPQFYYTGRGTVTDIYNGDPHKQADAMWAYFTLGEFMPPPEGVADEGGLALRVGEEPVVFRTFLEDAGTRAIAVGFPVGVHVAFDAENARFVDAWRGGFVDATSAWKGRGGQEAGGQGETLWTAPDGPPIVLGDPPAEWPGTWPDPEFGGYSIGDDGVPTFHYTIHPEDGAAVRISETIRPGTRPAPDGGAPTTTIRRRFEIAGHAGREIRFNPAFGHGLALRAIANAGASAAGAYVANDDGQPVVLELEITP